MPEKFATVTIGSATFEYREIARPTCEEIWQIYRAHPDWTIEHERCDDATCETCLSLFGPLFKESHDGR